MRAEIIQFPGPNLPPPANDTIDDLVSTLDSLVGNLEAASLRFAFAFGRIEDACSDLLSTCALMQEDGPVATNDDR